MGIDLIENIDYSIYNNNSSYVLSTAKKSDEIILSYMLAQTTIETIKLRSRNNRTFFALMKKIMDIEIETDDLKLTEFDKAMHSFSDSK